MPGPGAHHSILPIDDPLSEAQCRSDGRNSLATTATAWRTCDDLLPIPWPTSLPGHCQAVLPRGLITTPSPEPQLSLLAPASQPPVPIVLSPILSSHCSTPALPSGPDPWVTLLPGSIPFRPDQFTPLMQPEGSCFPGSGPDPCPIHDTGPCLPLAPSQPCRLWYILSLLLLLLTCFPSS